MNSFVLPHEHPLSRFRKSDIQAVRALLRSSLASAARAGITDIVDLTPYISPSSYSDLFRDLPVRVHGCVGYYLEQSVSKTVRAKTSEELLNALLRKARRHVVGIDIVAIKLAARRPSLTSFEKRAFEAGSRAHTQLDLPIVTHSPEGASSHVRVLTSLGVPPHRIMVSHPELSLKGPRARDFDDVLQDLLDLASIGVSFCFTDIYPKASAADRQTLELILRLVRAGHQERVLVSGDAAWKVDRSGAHFTGTAGRRAAGFDLVIDTKAKLERLGVHDDALQAIFRDNALRFYALDKS